MTRVGAAAALAGLLAATAAGPARADDGATVAGLEARVAQIKTQLHFVKELIDKANITALERARQLYSEAETQFLLENYDNCAAGLLEAVNIPEFRTDPSYAQALYYLGESLFQTENYAESKRYFRQALPILDAKKTREYQTTLRRLIRLADLTGDAQGVDQFYAQAQAAGAVEPELVYVYGKWTANRDDLPLKARDEQAIAEFATLTAGQPFYPEALYYRGALLVELHRLDEAIPIFQQLVEAPDQKNEPKMKLIKELGHLALGRIYYERNKPAEAIEQYRALPVDSSQYMQALFERAQVYLKLKDFESALETSDTLLLLGKDSPVLPDAQILQGNLLLKIGETDPEAYEKANAAFRTVVDTYQPVRDQIRAIIDRPDPVAYFNELLHRDPTADFTAQLPQAAQGFVDPTAQVAAAHAIPPQLAASRQTIDDSNALARKMLDALARGGLVAFPQLAEASSRAIELSNRLLQAESDVLHEQVRLLGEDVPEADRQKLAALEADHAALDKLFLQLPRSQAEYEKRLTRFRQAIAGLEKRAFEIRRQIDTINAVLTGLDRYWHDTRAERRDSPEVEAERDQDFVQWHRLVDQLDEQRQAIDRKITQERIAAGSEAAGGHDEDQLRDRYRAQLTTMQALIGRVLSSVRPENRGLIDRLGAARAEIDDAQGVLTTMRDGIRQRARDGVEGFRQRIVAEQVNLEDDQKGLGDLGSASSQLIGQIAVDSFRDVERDFYNIVLRGDVGLVDVAWSRKQQRTDTIEKYAKEKDQAEKALEDQFKEVLGDGD